MKLQFAKLGIAAFSLAALAGPNTATAWSASGPPSGHPIPGDAAVAVEPVKLLDANALEILVAPVALYPDDLLAVVLPASTHPLQVVLAARFLEAQDVDGNPAAPSEEWDDAIVALLNYPEVLALMDRNLDWTRQLGEALLTQEEDLVTAISAFRELAKNVGNLESDGKQEVVVNDAGTIEIKPAVPDEIYVPYYEPAEVIVRQPVRVYHYYPRPYPVYYYPYHQGYDFAYGPFWGVTSAFSIGWHTRNLHLHHYGFNDHPYTSYRYHNPFYYRQPHLILNIYDRDRRHRHGHRPERHHRGNDWRSERSKRSQRRWAARDDGRRGEGRSEDRRRGDRQRWTQQEQAHSIARALKTGANPTVHQPTQITPLGEMPPRPTPNKPGASRAQTAGAASAGPSPRQRAERQRTKQPGVNARRPHSRSQVVEPVATVPLRQPNRALPTHQARRPARPARPPATQARGNAIAPHQARPTQRAERDALERTARRAPARPQLPSSAELPRSAHVNRALPPRAQRPQAASRQATRRTHPQPNLNRGAPPRAQRPAPAARQATQQARQPRFNRPAPARAERPAKPTRPVRAERGAPQRPVRPRPGPSGDDFRSRRPR